jgi:hypothetical protein
VLEPETLDEAVCLKIIAETPPSKGRKGGKKEVHKKKKLLHEMMLISL